MLDIRATRYVSPPTEVPFTDVPLTVYLINYADETGHVTGLFRVYNATTGELIHTSEIEPITLTAGQSTAASALTDFSPPAPLDDTYFVIFTGRAVNELVPDGITIFLGAFRFDVKPGPLGPPPAAHHVTHEQAGSDPIETSDLGTSELDDTLTLHPDGGGGVAWAATEPAIHHNTHEIGGSDEISVAGLTGELADNQPPKSHGNASHTSTFEDQANKGIAGGYCGLPNPLDTTLPLRADGTPARPTGTHMEYDFCHGVNPSIHPIPWLYSAITSGTLSNGNGEPDHPGSVIISSAAGAGSGFSVRTLTTALRFGGNESSRGTLKPMTLAGLIIRHGFIDTSTAADCTNGAYFEIAQVGGVDGTAVGKTAAGGARSTTATSFLLITNTWYHFRISVNAATNLVTFTLCDDAGNILWTDTLNANIPTAVGQETGHGTIATRTGGATPLCAVDHHQIDIDRDLHR